MAGPISNYQQYSIASVQVVRPNGSLVNLTEEASVTIDHNTQSNPVFTVQKGYSGESPGSPMTEISVDNAVPAAGFELDPTQFMADNLQCKFIVQVANAFLQFDGVIYTSNFQHAVNTEAKLSFKARGSFSGFQNI